jgi:glycerol uptake facilitator-like aquaporin
LSGGAYNPAVGVGPLLADIGNIGARMQNVLIYIIGPMSGGLLAGLIYRLLNLKPATGEKKEKK